MHPPMLPNPSGEGFLLYKKRKMTDDYVEENTHDNIGMDLCLLLCVSLIPTHVWIYPHLTLQYTYNIKESKNLPKGVLCVTE